MGIQLKEASVKTSVLVALLLVLTLTAGTAAAQQAPFNEVGVTMGHWHIASKDVGANRKLFLAGRGQLAAHRKKESFVCFHILRGHIPVTHGHPYLVQGVWFHGRCT